MIHRSQAGRIAIQAPDEQGLEPPQNLDDFTVALVFHHQHNEVVETSETPHLSNEKLE